jgi:glycosyltransferase involved in cell wall biosynthesis
MLSQWALKYHSWKKRVAWMLFQAGDLRSAQAIHATSEREAHDIRALGLRQPIAIIPNGVEYPGTVTPRCRTTGERRAIFVSRIHPVKGLMNLIVAWARVLPANWTLTITGPDEIGYRKELEAAARREGIERSVRFEGTIQDENKWQEYASADLFILPTQSENFGIAIAEALAAGLPVITTREAPWRALEDHRCGWWIDTGVEPLVTALRDAVSMSDESRLEMGTRGRAYAIREFSWDGIASNMIDVYEWLLNGDKPPDVVVTD